MKKITDVAAFVFIIAVAVLSFVSVLGVWDLFDKDVIGKSFSTLGILALAAVIVMVSGKFIGDKQHSDIEVATIPNPAFKSIRKVTLAILIAAVSFLAILGVMSIWELIQDKDVLYKSMSSVGVLAFGAFIIVMTALEREGNQFMNNEKRSVSFGGIIVILFLAFLLFRIFFGLF